MPNDARNIGKVAAVEESLNYTLKRGSRPALLGEARPSFSLGGESGRGRNLKAAPEIISGKRLLVFVGETTDELSSRYERTKRKFLPNAIPALLRFHQARLPLLNSSASNNFPAGSKAA